MHRNNCVNFYNFVEPLPIPDALNRKLIDSKDICYGHLFYQNPEMDTEISNVRFMGSFSSPWNELTELIRTNLVDKNLGTFGISVGFLQADGDFPSLVPLNKDKGFQSYETGRKAMVIIVSSFRECKSILLWFYLYSCVLVTLAIDSLAMPSTSISSIPKKLIELFSNLGDDGAVYSTVRRRVLHTRFHGGIPVNLFDMKDYSKSLADTMLQILVISILQS